ncbi:MAG: GntR family transcriptional regulator, partial [Sneathiella sp.]|nr:GntR family transcriptional regulator [Sneathiella sp.]
MASTATSAAESSKKTVNTSSTLATSVYDRIRQDILTGVLTPNKKLRTDELRELYDAGNSPIREALNRLSSDGFVVREEQRGFHVAAVSRTELQELVKTRCWIEE